MGNSDFRLTVQGNLPVATVEAEGIVTGIVSVAGSCDCLEDGVVYRETGRAKACHRHSNGIFQSLSAVRKLGAQRIRRHILGKLVITSVGSDLVTAGSDFTDKMWKPFSNPA